MSLYTIVNLDLFVCSTALMMAASESHIGLFQLLTESKADPDVKDKDTCKAINYAISRNHPD